MFSNYYYYYGKSGIIDEVREIDVYFSHISKFSQDVAMLVSPTQTTYGAIIGLIKTNRRKFSQDVG